MMWLLLRDSSIGRPGGCFGPEVKNFEMCLADLEVFVLVLSRAENLVLGYRHVLIVSIRRI